MSDITDIYWEFNGVSLHTWAWAIETFGGGRMTPAGKRGDDLEIPFATGRTSTKKTRDGRSIPVTMWLQPRDQNGESVPGQTEEQMLHNNWNDLMDVLSTDGQAPLVKRFWEGSDVKAVTAMAEVLDFPEPNSSGYLQKFSFDFELADPWFYGPTESEGEGAFVPLGNETTRKVVFDLNVTGPARVEMSDDNWFEYSGGAGNLVVDSVTGLCLLNGLPVNGLMNRSFDFWHYAEFDPKAGPITVDFVSGISSGTIDYQPAYR